MTDHTATPGVVEGRRRADFPEGRTVEAMRPRDPWDTAPMLGPHVDGVAIEPRPMLEDAFVYSADRLDRLEHVLGELDGVVMRAGAQLEPLLTGGTYRDLDVPPHDPPTEPTPEDRRSTIARRVAGQGQRADRLADASIAIRIRLEAILDALEIE